MKRTLFVVAALVLFATAASASVLSVVSNKTTYSFGEAITLTVSGGDTGSAYGVYGRLEFQDALVNVTGAYPYPASTSPQTNLGGWTKSGLGTGVTGATEWVEAFAQIAGLTGKVASNLADAPGSTPFATVTLIAQNIAGVVNVGWNTPTVGNGDPLRFFGVETTANFSGTTFTIVPEPTTVALLGLGIVALGVRRRIDGWRKARA